MNASMVFSVVAGTSLFGLLGGVVAALGTTASTLNKDVRIEPLFTHLEAHDQALSGQYNALVVAFAEKQPKVMHNLEHALNQLFGLSRSLEQIMKKAVLNWSVVAKKYNDEIADCVRLLDNELDKLGISKEEQDSLFADMTALREASVRVYENVTYAMVNGSY